ncbi:MAG: Uma2 family endonuclease [Nitrospinae bacterium]|nr:Uma2 family endonuclease [Nitrospinota bacterium]
MTYPIKKEDKKYNYGDYLTWPNEERWELIDGVAYDMSPAPSRIHQEISVEILRQFANYLVDKDCKVYDAPFDVRLPKGNEKKDEDIDTIVQPDILVVCDKSKLDDKGCKGAPELIIEIVSPLTASMDYIKKLGLYERNQVKEYWIVQPVDKIVMIYKLMGNGKYGKPDIYSKEDEIKVGIFNGELVIDMKMVFESGPGDIE